MIEIIVVLEFLRAVNLILEIIHNQVERKKIDALIALSESQNQCTNCFKKLLSDQTDK